MSAALECVIIPLCWPNAAGRCGCGRSHPEKDVGKAPLVNWRAFVTTRPTPAQRAAWRTRWPHANAGELLEPLGALEVDLDSEAAIAEATALGLPAAPVVKTGKGVRYRFRTPPSVRGKRTAKRGRSHAIDVLAGGYVVIPPSRHRNGSDYRQLVAPQACPLTDAPAWAVRLLEESSTSATADMPLPESLPCVDLEALSLPPRIRTLIRTGADPRYPSRSEAVFGALQACIRAGYDDATIAAVFVDAAHGISEKPRECGGRWLAHEIARARAKADVEVFA